MTYTYFTEFYKKICEILSVNTGMPSQASSLVSNCDSDIVRIKGYLNEIIGSKWKESGAAIIRNNIVNQISKNVGEVNKFIKNNLEKAAAISINKLLPELKDMKAKDELLYKNKTTLESMKSSLTILQNNMPPKYKTDENGIKHINSAYTAAVNKVNRLIQEINELGKTISDQIQALNALKGAVDGYIMEISTLGNENIVIPAMNLPSNLGDSEIPLMVSGAIDYSNPANVGENGFYDEYSGLYYEVIKNKDLKVVLPDGREFMMYDQSYGRNDIKIPGVDEVHGAQCGACAYASILSWFGYGAMFSPEAVGVAVRQTSQVGAFNRLLSSQRGITGADNSKYFLSAVGPNGEQAQAISFAPSANPELDAYIKEQAKIKGITYNEAASDAKRAYAKEKITQTLEQGGAIAVVTSDTRDNKALSFTDEQHFIAIMGIDKNGDLIISNSTARSIGGANDPGPLLQYTRSVNIGGLNYYVPKLTLDQFVDNNIFGGKMSGNSITCIAGIQSLQSNPTASNGTPATY